jgi:PmbA protein
MDDSGTHMKSLIVKTMDRIKNTSIKIEAFYTIQNKAYATIRNSQINAKNAIEDAGVGFRVIVDQKVGFASTNHATEQSLNTTCKKALSMARASSRGPQCAFPNPAPLPVVKGLYDPAVEGTPIEDVVEVAQRSISAAESYDRRVKAKGGRVVYTWGWRGILNTEGMDVEEQSTTCLLILDGVGELPDGTVTGICSDHQCSRQAIKTPERLGESVGKRVVRMLNPQKISGFRGTVVFGPQAGSYQLTDALIDALNGETVQSGRSAWMNSTETPVTSEMVTLIDQGILPGGYSSRAFDDEGAPSQQTVLIEDGVLKSYLHTSTTSRTLQVPNTANASRYSGGFDIIHSIIGTGYRTLPRVYPSNLVLSPGTKSQSDLLSEISKGLLVESMDGFVQAGSGLISARLSQAFYIEKGDIICPVKGGMVSGSAFQWLTSLTDIGGDVKTYSHVIIPSLRVEDVHFVGA